MKKCCPFTIFMILGCTSFAWSQQIPGICTVTYIANEGFLLETAKHKVIVDALFGNINGNWCDQPGDSLLNLMFNGDAPFNNIDLVLVSHKHSDHFRAPMVISFLQHNPKSVLVCPEQVNNVLKKNPGYSAISKQIHSLKSDTLFDTTLNIHDIRISALRLKHGSWFEKDSLTGKTYDIHQDVENFGYLVETDGFIFFHSGDGSTANKARFTSYNLASKEIDVAFLDRVFLRPEGLNLIGETIRSKNIVFMHIEPGKGEYYQSVVKSNPEMFVFIRPGDKKVFNGAK